MLKTDANPGGLPIEVFDGIRASVSGDRTQYYQDISAPSTVPTGQATTSPRAPATRSGSGHAVGVKGSYDCIKAFSETDLTEDLEKIDVPTWIIHGEDDQIVPIVAAAHESSKIVKDTTSRCTRRPARLAQTTAYKDTFNTDLLSFIKG